MVCAIGRLCDHNHHLSINFRATVCGCNALVVMSSGKLSQIKGDHYLSAVLPPREDKPPRARRPGFFMVVVMTEVGTDVVMPQEIWANCRVSHLAPATWGRYQARNRITVAYSFYCQGRPLSRPQQLPQAPNEISCDRTNGPSLTL